MLLSVAAVTEMGLGMVTKYLITPTAVDVKDTHQPLHSIPFPAITVCPGTRVRRGKAMKLLSRYLPKPLTNLGSEDKLMLLVMDVLSLLQFPNFSLMLPYLKSEVMVKNKHLFADLNITDFMLQVMPSCEHVFVECLWRGLTVNCCEVFTLQRTEEGFCWAFNSLTSESTLHCPPFGVLGIAREVSKPECELRYNPDSSRGSGLEVILQPTDPQDNIGFRAQRTPNGVSVHIQAAGSYPLAGSGVYVPSKRGSRTSLGLAAEISTSHSSLRDIPLTVRRCLFPGEVHRPRRSTYPYSLPTCTTECRAMFIIRTCGCLLYFYKLIDVRVPECGIRHLTCIAKYSDTLRFLIAEEKVPDVSVLSMSQYKACKCLPTCEDALFDVNIQRTEPEEQDTSPALAHLEVHYRKSGFIIYEQTLVFGFLELIGSLGALANLFLGFSLLSLIETIYWAFKIIIASFRPRKELSNVIHVQPTTYLE